MVKSHNVDMINGPIVKNLLAFALPVTLFYVLKTVFHATDIAILGIFSDDYSVGSVGATTALINLFANFFTGISVGANILIARAVGEQNTDRASKYVGTSFFCSIFAGIFLSVLMLIGARTFLTWMNCPDNLLDKAITYVKVYFLGMPLILLYTFSAAVMRAKGETVRPLFFLIVGGLVNVVLNIFFIVVLNLDVAGVAIATIVSNGITAILSIKAITGTDDIIRFEKKHFRFYGKEVKEIICLGLPAAVQTSLFSISNVLFSSTFNKFGDIAVSGNTVAHQYDDILANTLSGFNAGVLTFISQNLGAKKYKRVWKTLWVGLFFIMTFGFTLGSLAYLFSPTLCGLMSDSNEVIACAIRRMRIMSTTQFIAGAMTLFSNLLKAIKKPVLSMIGSIFFTLILRLLWLYTIFPLNPTLETYYIVYPITWLICAVVFAVVGIIILRKIQLKDECALTLQSSEDGSN